MRWWQSISAMCLLLSGCVIDLPVKVAETDISGTLVIGRVNTAITGESQRIYLPELRSFEVINTDSRERFKIDVKSKDQYF